MLTSTDVTILGGGMAGVATAHVLARRGVKTVLVDLAAQHPTVFKAEKAGPHSWPMFDKLGLSDHLRKASAHIESNLDARDGRIVRRLTLGERGYYYHDLVNAVRAALPPELPQIIGRVTGIQTSADRQKITLQGGDEIDTRLVIVATGNQPKVHELLGVEKNYYVGEEACGFAFLIQRADGRPFWFDGSAMTYYPNGSDTRMSYFSMFPIPNGMRVNFFGFRPGKDPWVHEMQRRPEDVIRRTFPKLMDLTGEFKVATKVESAVLNPYEAVNVRRDGIVLMGDALMTVPPSTGKGVYKLFYDVDAATQLVPRWLDTPGMGVDKINTYYDHPQRREAHVYAREKALYSWWSSTSATLRATIHREKHFLMERAKDLVGYTADVGA